MPIYEFQCPECGHQRESFYSQPVVLHSELCEACNALMGQVMPSSFGSALWAEEGRPRTIWNLGPEPITVRSAKEHKDAMRKAGVVPAGTNLKRGEKGRWI